MEFAFGLVIRVGTHQEKCGQERRTQRPTRRLSKSRSTSHGGVFIKVRWK
jgi:hypothetical protein